MGFHPHLPLVRFAYFQAHGFGFFLIRRERLWVYSSSIAPEGQKNSVVQRPQSVHFSSSILLV